jgi:hypothetical protein
MDVKHYFRDLQLSVCTKVCIEIIAELVILTKKRVARPASDTPKKYTHD